MTEFEVTIVETLKRKVVVKAENAVMAEDIVDTRWSKGEIVLNGDSDYAGIRMEVRELPRNKDNER